MLLDHNQNLKASKEENPTSLRSKFYHLMNSRFHSTREVFNFVITFSSSVLLKDQRETSNKERVISTKLYPSQDSFRSSSNHLEEKTFPSFEITSKLASEMDSNEINPYVKFQDSFNLLHGLNCSSHHSSTDSSMT